MQFAAAMTTAQESGQQQLSAPNRSLDGGAAFACGVVGDHALVPLELLPGDVGLVMILDQNIPFGHRPMHATPHALAPLLDAHLARRTPEGIGASVDWICQNVVRDFIGRQSPDDTACLAIAQPPARSFTGGFRTTAPGKPHQPDAPSSETLHT